MDNQKYLILDYETRSRCDLKKAGAYEYANHPTTQIMCISWRLGTRESLRQDLRLKAQWDAAYYAQYPNGTMANPHDANIWTPAFGSPQRIIELQSFMCAEDIILVAHNALFEQVITRFVLSKLARNEHLKDIPHDRWVCTASLAASLALPRNLDGACQALELPTQKDMTGHRLMLKLSKPRKPSKNNPGEWHCQMRDLKRLMQYCQRDVDAETMIFLTLPPLNEIERQVWLLDQKINFKGFKVDREMVDATLTMITEERKHLNKETKGMTFGKLVSTTQRDGVLKWLQTEGIFLPDLRAKTVRDAISENLVEGDAKRILQIRQAISKTSTKKYSAFEARSRTDGRVRDFLVYHTASTGRWGGSGVQPQNFPRGNISDTTLAAEVLRAGDLEFTRLIYGNPMDVFSSCLRSVIIAPEGRELFCADYAAIEARVLFWVAKHSSGLKAFYDDRPMYEEMACQIYKIAQIENVTKAQRQVGKQTVLGCGYGMGWKKFVITCKNFGMDVDEELAQTAVSAYRSFHQPVVKLWSNLEKAAIEAVRRKGTKFKINHTSWWVESLPNTRKEFLWCELPSGRRLAYFKPVIKYEKTPWDEKRAVLYHYGVNPLTKKWESAGTYGGRLTENVVQAIARDLMAEAMLTIDKAGYDLTLTVHDEILAEHDKTKGNIKEFEQLMASIPHWALGCPVRVEGWNGPRYKK